MFLTKESYVSHLHKYRAKERKERFFFKERKIYCQTMIILQTLKQEEEDDSYPGFLFRFKLKY